MSCGLPLCATMTGLYEVFIHPTADVSPQAALGTGTRVWHHAHIREGAVLGQSCIVGEGVYIDAGVVVGNCCKIQNGALLYHPAVLEDGIFIGPGAVLTNDRFPRAVNLNMTLKTSADWHAEGSLLQAGCSIGAGAILLPGVTIGRWAMVGAGSVITRSVPDHALVVGSPARLVGYVSPEGRRLVQRDAQLYVDDLTGFQLIISERHDIAS